MLIFFFIGTSATKRFAIARSRIFRYGLSHDILSKRQRKREGGAYRAPSPPPCFKGLSHALVVFYSKLALVYVYVFLSIVLFVKKNILH